MNLVKVGILIILAGCTPTQVKDIDCGKYNFHKYRAIHYSTDTERQLIDKSQYNQWLRDMCARGAKSAD